MIRRIVLENFMSHKRTVIEPAEGLTVLTGPNNCGKSAVVVALQTLCRNDRNSKAYIRHHEKEARVTVETGDGHKLEWFRSGSVGYRIDGREIHRLNGGVPDDLHELLGLPEVTTDGAPFEIHFAEQKSPIFLLNEPGSRAATFFAASSDARLLLQMQGKHKDNVKDARAEERLLNAQIEEANRELSRFDGLAGLEAKTLEAQRLYDKLSGDLASAESLYTVGESITDAQRKMAAQAEVKNALKPLTPPPVVPETHQLSELCRSLTERADAIDRESGRAESLKPLQAPPQLEDTCAGLELAREIAKKATYISRLGAKLDCVQGLQQPPDASNLSDLSDLNKVVHALSIAERATESRAAAARAATDEIAAMRQSIDRFLSTNPTCPTCGGNVEADKLLAGGHSHA